MAEDGGTPTAPTHSHRLRRWLLCSLGGIVVLALVAAGAIVFRRQGRLHSLETLRAEAREEGLATSTEELMRRLPPIDEESNAATLYERAFATPFDWKSYRADSDFVPVVSRRLSVPPDQSGLPPQLRQAVLDVRSMNQDPRVSMPDYILKDTEDYLSRRQGVLGLIHQAAALPEARYHVAWSGAATSLPHLTKMRGAARLMQVAMMVDAEEKRPADAILKAREGLRMARSFEGRPLIVESLFETGAYSIIQTGLTRVLARTTPENRDLLALQADLELFADGLSGRPALEGDFAMRWDTLDLVRSGRISIPTEPAMYLHAQGTVFEGPINRWVPQRFIMDYFETETAVSLGSIVRSLDNVEPPNMEFIRARASNPSMQQLTYLDPCSSEAADLTNARYLLQVERTRAKARAAAAALACLRYRNDAGEWPTSLDALVPKYIAKAPTDPMTGKPLLYSIGSDGIVIYSVGTNGRDDGGHGPDLVYGDEDAKAGRDDSGFHVWTEQHQTSDRK